MPTYAPSTCDRAPCVELVYFLLTVCNSLRTFASHGDLLGFCPADDISRVKLSVQNHSTDDYINANYMPVSVGGVLRARAGRGEIFRVLLSVSVMLNLCCFPFLGLPFQEGFYCHTRAFTQHFERFLASRLGEKCIYHCYVDQVCWTGKGKYILKWLVHQFIHFYCARKIS